MIRFTPKKFIDALELNGIKFTHLTHIGIDRSYFIPRYKKGSHKIKNLGSYKKRIREETVEKIAKLMVDFGFFDDEKKIISCFKNDDFERLLPEDIL
jgi:hypothetical protein